MSGPVPCSARTLPERFIVKDGRVRSTHDTFDEGECFLYVDKRNYGFLIPTGKKDGDGAPVFDDFIAFPSQADADEWVAHRNQITQAQTHRVAAPRG